MRHYVWTFKTPAKAAEVAHLLTAQNEAGRQAMKCEPRRFLADGCRLLAERLD